MIIGRDLAMLADTPPAAAIARAQHWLREDPARALGNFTWVNNVTAGAQHCRFAFAGPDADPCLALHTGLPFLGVSLMGEDAALVRELAAELVPPAASAYSLVPDALAQLLAETMTVIETRREWLMLFRGDADALDPGPARLLTPADLPTMTALAASAGAMVFNEQSLARGAFFGVESEGRLIAMGGVQTGLPGWSEIGSIVTHPAYRRRGHASQIVAALVRHLAAHGQGAFLCLFQTNAAARALYEKLGFVTINQLTLVEWQIPHP